jgi:hypothetical protein
VTNRGHFKRFSTSVFDWKTAVSPAVSVGLSRLAGIDDGFPRNWNGYAQHYGVNVLGNLSGKFFANFAFPILFRQDEQFERRGATTGFLNRLTHVGLHAVWAGQGLTPLNMSSLGGNTVNSILANAYQPQSQRTIGATAHRFGLGMLLYVGGDAYTEFSPDVWRALKKFGSIVGRMTSRSAPTLTQPANLDYGLLTDAQKKLAAEAVWKGWSPSQQLQYAGGTQALANWCALDPRCKASLTAHLEPGLEQVNTVQIVNSTVQNAQSADEYNIEVFWQPGADKCFENAFGWGTHMAQLHKGMYGYDQNKWNDSFLGLVVLFDRNDSKKGQFHIGFGDGVDHYSAGANSNIEQNYRDYCGWYGTIKGFKECELILPPPPPSPPAEAPAVSPPPVVPPVARSPIEPATAEGRNELEGTVQAFLREWYVQADYAGLQRFVAQDNVFRGNSTQSGEVQWLNFFRAASKPSGVKLTSLKDAISYSEPNLPKRSKTLQYINLTSAKKLADPFAIVDPESAPRGSYFPSTDLAEARQQLSARGRYFDHLKRTYSGRLYLVVYATKAPLIPEGVVLYWILEGPDWKLAAVQITD